MRRHAGQQQVQLRLGNQDSGMGGLADTWLDTPNEHLSGRTPLEVWREYGYEAVLYAMSDFCVGSAMMAYPALMMKP